jgi:predicted small secreted protein
MRKRTSRVWVNVPALVLVSCVLISLAPNTRADEGEDLYFGANALYNRAQCTHGTGAESLRDG